MRFPARASLLASALLAATAATAADLPPRSSLRDGYVAPPVFTWTGLYVGLTAGAALGTFTRGSNQIFGSSPAGVIGGGTVGYNYQISPDLVVGAEADISGTSYAAGGTVPFYGIYGAGRMPFLATVRGRMGYTVDRAMFFVTGGLAVASLQGRVTDWGAGFPFFGSQRSWQPGFTIGGGLEYALTNTVSAKVEYLYTSTGNGDYFPYTRDYSHLGTDFSTVRAGVNYHF